jgi:hypothetical protein
MYNAVPAGPITARRGRIALAGAVAVACLALSACSGPLDTPNAGSSSGGDHGSGHRWAPPISMPQPEPPYTHPAPNLDHGCAEVESANGFPCVSVPGTGGVIYPGPDPDPF